MPHSLASSLATSQYNVSFIHQWLYNPLLDPWPLFQFLNPRHSWFNSLDGSSAHRKVASYTQNNTDTDIHASSGIRTHDPSVRAGEDSSCLRPRGHCDRHNISYWMLNKVYCSQNYCFWTLSDVAYSKIYRKHNVPETGSVSVLR
jgi:hypothetical protein